MILGTVFMRVLSTLLPMNCSRADSAHSNGADACGAFDWLALEREESGQSMVEAALVLPLLLLLVMGVLAFGLTFNNYIALTEATGVGARQLAISRGTTLDPCATVATAISGAAPLLKASSISYTLNLNGTVYSANSCPQFDDDERAGWEATAREYGDCDGDVSVPVDGDGGEHGAGVHAHGANVGGGSVVWARGAGRRLRWRRSRRLRNEESGQILVMSAVLMIAFLGMVALVVDYGHVVYAQRELQAATDAAALAGAQAFADAQCGEHGDALQRGCGGDECEAGCSECEYGERVSGDPLPKYAAGFGTGLSFAGRGECGGGGGAGGDPDVLCGVVRAQDDDDPGALDGVGAGRGSYAL